jgi:predicted RNA-binding protein with PIN domain
MSGAVVLLDAENVRRSRWPNIAAADLVERCRAWGEREGVAVEVVFDGKAPAAEPGPRLVLLGSGSETADAWLARRAASLRARGTPFWLVTSDRALRAEAGPGAERVVGGGSFLRELEDEHGS